MIIWRRLAEIIAQHGAAALVSVHQVKGSAPREEGARMVVRPDGAFHGTIGGGRLEWEALAAARQAIVVGRGRARLIEQALGPDLGQCCGGRVTLLVEVFDRRDLAAIETFAHAEDTGNIQFVCTLAPDGRVERQLSELDAAGDKPAHVTDVPVGRWDLDGPDAVLGGQAAQRWREIYGERRTPVLLFGAGHVGRALVLALAPLRFTVRWIDGRDDAFPRYMPANVTPIRASDPTAEIAQASSDAFVLVMTHEHPLDLAITSAALQRDFPYVGLIGSETKRARFVRRFREIGLTEARIADLVCPIGLPGIKGKEPAIIAASVAAQLLQEQERLAAVPSFAAPIRRKKEDSLNDHPDA